MFLYFNWRFFSWEQDGKPLKYYNYELPLKCCYDGCFRWWGKKLLSGSLRLCWDVEMVSSNRASYKNKILVIQSFGKVNNCKIKYTSGSIFCLCKQINFCLNIKKIKQKKKEKEKFLCLEHIHAFWLY